MATMKELRAQRAELDRQIEEVSQKERAEAIKTIQELIAENMLTQNDIFPSARAVKVKAPKALKTGVKLAPKYADPSTGDTWSGRGKDPAWLAGKNKDDYLVVKPTTETGGQEGSASLPVA